jgi:hypothetical protein
MATWQIVLYAFASFWALRSLVSLMSQHRKGHRRRVLARETERIQNEAAGNRAKSTPASPGKAA